MKNRKTRTLALVLAVVMAFGLSAPVLAAGQTFSDVPEGYWGYADIEAVAEAGLMNGTGNGAFSPEMKVSVAQFLTLLGRLVFPEVKAEGADWFGPYVTAAQEAGLLAGSQVNTNNVEAEISRYDMAVILRAAANKLGVAEKAAQSSEVTDYGLVPTMYADAVLAVYGMGLIKGDQAGNFNGSNTMMRAEVATVIMRLKKIPEEQAKAEKEEADRKAAEDQAAFEASRTGEYVTVNFYGRVSRGLPNIPVGLYFKDGRLLGQTVSDENGKWSMDITMDKADYSRTEAWYYAAIIGQVEDTIYGGMIETKDYDKRPESIWENTFNTTQGFLARGHSV